MAQDMVSREGLLQWIEESAVNGMLCMEIITQRPFPSAADASQTSEWLRGQLKDLEQMDFFTVPLLASRRPLQCSLIEQRELSQHSLARVEISMAELLNLPNLNPSHEVADLAEFLRWVQEQRSALAERDIRGVMGWGRGGDNQKPRHKLQWMGPIPEAELASLEEATQAKIASSPVISEWLERQRQNLRGKMRVHSWIIMPPLVSIHQEWEAKQKRTRPLRP